MTQMMQVIYFSCITDHMWINRYVPIQQESLCNIYIRKLKSYCKHTQHCNFGKSRPIRHAIWLFWGSHGFPHRFTLCLPPLWPMSTFYVFFRRVSLSCHSVEKVFISTEQLQEKDKNHQIWTKCTDIWTCKLIQKGTITKFQEEQRCHFLLVSKWEDESD